MNRGIRKAFAGFVVLLLLVGLFTFWSGQIKPVHATSANFGYTTAGSLGDENINGIIRGSNGTSFTPASSGTVDEIHAYVLGSYSAGSAMKVKCAIYKASDLSLVANSVTNENVTADPGEYTGWVTCGYSGTKPSVVSGTDYYLVAWGNRTGGGLCYLYEDFGLSQGGSQTLAYGSFPNPFVPSGSNRVFSVYANYTVSGGDVTPPTYSSPTVNTTKYSQPCNFSVALADNIALANYTFGTNNTGHWVNETWTQLAGSPASYEGNITKTLNETVGNIVQWEYWFSDTSNNTANTGIQSLTITLANFIVINSYPYTITSAGSYGIIASATSTTAILITVATNDVFLDGQNYQLTGDNTNEGVYSLSQHNITIVNMNLTTFHYGIALSASYNVDVENSTFGPMGSSTGWSVFWTNGCYNCTDRNLYSNGDSLTSDFGGGDTGGHDYVIDNVTGINGHHTVLMQGASSWIIENSVSSGGDSFAIEVTTPQCSNFTITNFNATNVAGNGIELDGASNGTVSKSNIGMNNTAGYCSVRLDASKLITVTNCTLDNGATNQVGYPVVKSFDGSGNLTVSECVLKNSPNGFADYDAADGNLTILLNNFINCSTPVTFQNTGNTTVLHNNYTSGSGANSFTSVTNNVVNDSSLGLTMSKVGSGTITPDVGLNYVNGGNWSQTFTATPSGGYSLTSFTFNGVVVGTTSPLTHEIATDSTMVITFTSTTIDWTAGLPSADVYVVRNDTAGNYLTFSSDRTTILETNTNPVTALNNVFAGTAWLPTNGKIVTNGTWPDYYGTVAPARGSFAWEAWKTVATVTGGLDTYGDIINLLDKTFIQINNLTIDGAGIATYGIRAYAGSNFNITYCHITNCLVNALLLGSSNSIVEYNNFTDCSTSSSTSGGYAFKAIQLGAQNNTVIADNFIKINPPYGGGGILLDTGNANDTIANNTILGVTNTHALYLGYGGPVTCYNNTVVGQSYEDTGYSNCGIAAKDFGQRIYNNSITVYGIDNDCYGIAIYNQSGSTPGHSTWDAYVVNNTITVIGSTLGDGIFLSINTGPLKDVWIQNNTITGPWTDGIGIGNNNDTVITENVTIIGNHISGSTKAISVGLYWESMDYINDTLIHDNVISSVTTSLFIHAGVTNTFVYNNTGLIGYNMLNMTVVGSGTTSPSGLGWQYISTGSASVVWTPNSGYVRQDFSISGVNQSSTTSPISVTMSADHLCVAYFTGIAVTVTITAPTNTTYTSSSVSVNFGASGGTIDKEWFNCKNGTSWIYVSNQTYSGSTSMTGFVNGTSYKLYAWANNTDATVGEASVMFSVQIPDMTVVITVTSPSNSTYTLSSILVSFSASSSGSIDKKWWNCKNGTSWIYGSNQTYTIPVNMTGFVNGTSYKAYIWANATDGTVGQTTVMFTVQISLSDVNKDGDVSLGDAVLLAVAYGSVPSSSNWNAAADINNDGTVNLADAVLLAINYGYGVP